MSKTTYRTFTRSLKLNFYTSSIDKLLQARLKFSEHGYSLGYFRGRREPYDEDYSSTTNNLLTKAVGVVKGEFGLKSPFFIEDTSIRIETLSGGSDFPGMRAKEWFAGTTFAELDQELRFRGNERFATVKSDIALHLPNYPLPIFFHGETTGVVAASPPNFNENPLYPWLTPRTFNGWFIPDGQPGVPRRLGEMEYENSLDYDFRVRSLNALIEFYDQINAALNIPNTFIETRGSTAGDDVQLSMSFQPTQPVLCVIGEKCAGKTTLANELLKDHDAVHVEASSLFAEIAAESGVEFKNDEEVINYLSNVGFDVVAKRVVERIDEKSDRFTVVTGLRTPEEISYLLDRVQNLLIVYVSTEQRLRYERHLRRQRDPTIHNFKTFQERDEWQRRYGVLRFASEIADTVITNDGTLVDYLAKIDALASEALQGRTTRLVSTGMVSEGHRSLSALVDMNRIATCQEISDQTLFRNEFVRLYNVNRALKELPEFATRIERKNERLSYGPTPRAQPMLRLLNRKG